MSTHASGAGGPCEEVGRASVGEPGSSALLAHRLQTDRTKLMVVRTVETSLCGDTGVAALLLVDGEPRASGVITAGGSGIQAEAGDGQAVVAIAHTFPLFNDIHCVRLGELTFTLEECDLVG